MAHFHLSMKAQPRRKDGGKLSAKSHYDYIARQNQYAHMKGRQEDFVLAESGNLPAWAHGNAGTFWDEAEAHRSPKGTAYREIELGLQEELSLEDNVALLKGFMEEFHIDRYAYTFAVHSKDSTLEQGHTNIHAHLMFCEKIQEVDRPLGPDKFFQRYRETESGEKTGGYKSSQDYRDKKMLCTMRKRWAERVNEMFKACGIDAEITEKNNADRYDELVEQGRYEEAESVNRTAAPHLGRAYRNDAIMAKLRDMEEEELRLKQLVDDAKETYRKARCEVWEEKQLQDEAITSVLGEDWHKEKQRLLGLQGTLKAIRRHLYDQRTPEEEKAFLRRNRRVMTAYDDCRKKMAQWDKLQADKQGDIDTIYASLKAANDARRKTSNKAYGDLKRKEKQLRAFQNKRVLLKANYEPDDILFAEKLARKVQPYGKVLGRQPLKDLMHGPYQGKEYYLTGEIHFNPEKREWKGLAIRVGDDMDRGKAPVYQVLLREEGPEQDIAIVEAKPTKEKIAMYKELHTDRPRCQNGKFQKAVGHTKGPEKPFKGASPTPPRPIAKAAVQKLNALMDEATKSETGRVNIHWQDDERRYTKKTEMERTEEELYQGWSM